MKSVMDQFTIHPRAKAPVGRSIGTRLNDVYGANCMTFSVMFRFKNPVNGRMMVAHIIP